MNARAGAIDGSIQAQAVPRDALKIPPQILTVPGLLAQIAKDIPLPIVP